MGLSVVLLHDQMVDKQSRIVTTSLTLIDIHDISRSSRTFGVNTFYISHSSEKMRSLAYTLIGHWDHGYGASYNPKRKDALSVAKVLSSFDEVIEDITQRNSKKPIVVMTSAKKSGSEQTRVTFSQLREKLKADSSNEYLLCLGTGWGMSEELLAKGDLFLEPIYGAGEFNHLSVRSALAIMLSRICV